MKKLFFLCLSFLTMTAQAQIVSDGNTDKTFQFVDEQGNIVPDGAVITVNSLNEDGFMVVPLYVKNMSGERSAASLYEEIDEKPNGDWQTCAFGSCKNLQGTGYSSKCKADADYNESINTEWMPEEEGYASWQMRMQIHVFDIVTTSVWGQVIETISNEAVAFGPTVTVKFIYADPTGIDNVHADAAARNYYGTDGRRSSTPQKGLNIVRLSNGKAVKRLFR